MSQTPTRPRRGRASYHDKLPATPEEVVIPYRPVEAEEGVPQQMNSGYIPCIAYTDAGVICGAPATQLDRQRGGMVCPHHAPDVPLAPPAPTPAWGPRRPVETHQLPEEETP
jgi:hypothetical protein